MVAATLWLMAYLIAENNLMNWEQPDKHLGDSRLIGLKNLNFGVIDA